MTTQRPWDSNQGIWTDEMIVNYVRAQHPTPGEIKQGMRFMLRGTKYIITSVSDTTVRYVNNDGGEFVWEAIGIGWFKQYIENGQILPAHLNVD